MRGWGAYVLPCAAVAWPLLHVAAWNASELKTSDYLTLLLYWLVLSLLSVSVLAVVRLFTGTAYLERASPALAVLLAGCFLFEPINAIWKHVLLQVIGATTHDLTFRGLAYAATVLALSAAAFRAARHESAIAVGLAFTCAASLLPLWELGRAALPVAHREPTAMPGPPIASAVIRPNVYFLVPDMYARADTLLRVFGFDNGPFIEALQHRGFLVQHDSYANYPATATSIASTLEMRYLAAPELPRFADTRPFTSRISGDAAVVRRFRRHGYQYVQGAAISGVECRFADRCLGEPAGLTLVDYALLEMTPARKVISHLLARQERYFDTLQQDLDSFDTPSPVFVFAHAMQPHPPFLLDADCQRRSETGDEPIPGDSALALQYVAALACTNAMLLRLIDDWRTRDPDAIIVLQGDHGTEFTAPWEQPLASWPASTTDEVLANLSAIHLPPGCAALASQPFSPVNTFRIVFACVEGQSSVDRLPDRYFLINGEHMPGFGQVVEVYPHLARADVKGER